jgi:hypothetical protein
MHLIFSRVRNFGALKFPKYRPFVCKSLRKILKDSSFLPRTGELRKMQRKMDKREIIKTLMSNQSYVTTEHFC